MVHGCVKESCRISKELPVGWLIMGTLPTGTDSHEFGEKVDSVHSHPCCPQSCLQLAAWILDGLQSWVPQGLPLKNVFKVKKRKVGDEMFSFLARVERLLVRLDKRDHWIPASTRMINTFLDERF